VLKVGKWLGLTVAAYVFAFFVLGVVIQVCLMMPGGTPS
jgi:hypothetical protein